MLWTLRGHQFIFPSPCVVMGVINVTPDSFSDGGDFLDPGAAADHALRLAGEGADIVDIGGESTRPGATPVAEKEELRRVMPVIGQLSGQIGIPISIDSRKPLVARTALEAGACIVNNIAANRRDDEMGRVVAETGAGYICMHMQGSPSIMQQAPAYSDVLEEVGGFFANQLAHLENLGVQREQVVLDPGIGFGKNVKHNLKLLSGLNSFSITQRPLLLGVSRKSFIGKVLGISLEERLSASLACAVWAVLAGVQILRVHNVAETVQAVRMVEAIQQAKLE